MSVEKKPPIRTRWRYFTRRHAVLATTIVGIGLLALILLGLFLYRLGGQADLANLGGDLIIGFEAGKDKIDLVDLFLDFGFDSEDVIGDGFLKIEVVGGNTILGFDSDGGGNGFVTLATLQGVTNLGLSDLLYPSPSIV